MSDYIFDPDRCPVPPLNWLPRDPLVADCTIPEAPEAILECPETTPPEPQLPPVPAAALTGGGGGGGGGGNECPVTIGEICSDTFAAIPVTGALPVSGLYVRKDSSLRVWGIPSPCDPLNKIDALIDIGGGPSDSVFWQPAGGGPPQWTTGLRLGTFVAVGTLEQPGWLISIAKDGTPFGIAGRAGQYWQTPENFPRPGGLLLCDAVNGQHVGLKWSYPGVNGNFAADGVNISVHAGIITSISPSGTEYSPGEVEPDVTFPIDHRPCG